MPWSIENWMKQNRDAVDLALLPLAGDELLVPERAFLAYAIVEFDAALRVEAEGAVDGGEERSGR